MSYIPHSTHDIQQMCSALKINSIDELFTNDIPANIFNPTMNLDSAINEISLTNHINFLSKKNITTQDIASFLGAGAYNHYIPPAIAEITRRAEFYTAYTPYQPEASQGILQAMFEFQTMICNLTGMDISNASLYDGATALAEAILMSVRTTQRKKIILCDPINPLYKQVIQTYARAIDLEIIVIPDKDECIDFSFLKNNFSKNDFACVVMQYPNFLGVVEDLTTINQWIKEQGAISICSVNPIALGLFETPAAMGADIITGEGQPLGIPLSFGGPYLGFLAAKNNFLRQMPGRIVGQTTDIDGKVGYTLTIQTREQHIRREKATSNICSNQALMALAATVYLAYMGKNGLNTIAKICYDNCLKLKKSLNRISNKIHFNEFVLELPYEAKLFIKKCKKEKILPGFDLKAYDPNKKNSILVCVTEMTTEEEMEQLCLLFLKKQNLI